MNKVQFFTGLKISVRKRRNASDSSKILKPSETDENYDIVVDGVSYYFIIVIIFAIAWCILWLFKLYLIAAIIHLFLFVAIAYICLTIDLYYESKGFFDNLLIRKPFSMWAGFALYTTILSFWIAIPALDTVFLSVIALIILIIVGLFVVDYYPFKDSSFSIAILWVLIGISCYQVKVIPVFTVTVLGSGLITGGILKSIFDWYDEQQNSLAMLN
ncbi:16562_t:CDS:2 [Cetraspora pellucida]|uniref:16562_t:CDS:1 n=1 Tax=Cetraspora pellucida TaxID=1433469 RepID=A0A9N9GF93_9GLOM|nr:16562_t:CDS:2 [Cetraspora pellucida]